MDKTCKYYQYQRYVSYDNGQTWQPMNQFQRGELMEFNSLDCGAGVDAIYKWVEMDINSDYLCDNCDYVPTAIYRWRAANVDDYICSGTTKYYKEYKEESTNSGATWSTVYPIQYRMSNQIIETQSDDCGYTIYRWVDSGFTCDGKDKYNQVIQQMSRDSGTTWTNVTPSVFSATTLIEENSDICQGQRLHIWTNHRGVNGVGMEQTPSGILQYLGKDGNANHYVLYTLSGSSEPKITHSDDWDASGIEVAIVYLNTASGVERNHHGDGIFISKGDAVLTFNTINGYLKIVANVDGIYTDWADIWWCLEDNLHK